MTSALPKPVYLLIKETRYLTLMGQPCGVCCKDFEGNWLHYNIRHRRHCGVTYMVQIIWCHVTLPGRKLWKEGWTHIDISINADNNTYIFINKHIKPNMKNTDHDLNPKDTLNHAPIGMVFCVYSEILWKLLTDINVSYPHYLFRWHTGLMAHWESSHAFSVCH